MKVESRPEVKNLRALKSQVEEVLNRDLEIESEVEVVAVGTIPRTIVRAKRLVKAY